MSDGSGVVRNVNRYDEYGQTQNSNNLWLSRLGYTGQRWFSGHDLYHYRTGCTIPGPAGSCSRTRSDTKGE